MEKNDLTYLEQSHNIEKNVYGGNDNFISKKYLSMRP